MESNNSSGPGYKCPLSAVNAPREKILYVTCVNPRHDKPDYLAVLDVDPSSPTFMKVKNRMVFPYKGDELHHFGWNACSSCHGKPGVVRDKLIFPCLNTDRVYIVDVSNFEHPTLHKIIEPNELHKLGLSTPHTSHCLPSGEIMISTMGAGPSNEGKGSFLLLDATNDFRIKGTWSPQDTPFGYDFWYQPKFDVLISTEWGAPKAFKKGFDPADVGSGLYGQRLHVWSYRRRRLIQTIDLGPDGLLPLEIRFLHNPHEPQGYVGCALSSNIFHFSLNEKSWVANKVISVPPKKVDGWALPDMPAAITDLIISMDDKYLYFANWLHGDLRQYDISKRDSPKLTAQVFIGGSIAKGGPVKVTEDQELKEQPDQLYVKGRKITGGPNMIQVSLDGTRVYVTTSLYSAWDKQFYPELTDGGGCLLMLDVDVANGGMKVNPDFLVDFGKEPNGPMLCHEMHYLGGDCSSDVFVPCPSQENVNEDLKKIISCNNQ